MFHKPYHCTTSCHMYEPDQLGADTGVKVKTTKTICRIIVKTNKKKNPDKNQ